MVADAEIFFLCKCNKTCKNTDFGWSLKEKYVHKLLQEVIAKPNTDV